MFKKFIQHLKGRLKFEKNWFFELEDILEVIILFLAIFVGLYIGIWVCFIGGIIQILEAYKAGIEATGIAFGVFKTMFAAPLGMGAAYITFLVLNVLNSSIFKRLRGRNK